MHPSIQRARIEPPTVVGSPFVLVSKRIYHITMNDNCQALSFYYKNVDSPFARWYNQTYEVSSMNCLTELIEILRLHELSLSAHELHFVYEGNSNHDAYASIHGEANSRQLCCQIMQLAPQAANFCLTKTQKWSTMKTQRSCPATVTSL